LHGHGNGWFHSYAIAVPDSSILRDDNNQPFVYLAIGANQFGRRDVEIGEASMGKRIFYGAFPRERGLWATAACSSVC